MFFLRKKPPFSFIPIFSVIEAFIAVNYLASSLPAKPFSWFLLRLLGINFVLWTVYVVEIWSRIGNPLRRLPGPKGGYPLVGYGPLILQQPLGKQFIAWAAEVPNNGIIGFRGFGNQYYVFCTKPNALADLLVTKTYDFVKPDNARKLLRRIIGDGLIVVESDTHQFQRKNVMPSFRFRQLKELYPVMWAKSETLTEVLSAELRKQAGDAAREASPSGVVEINHWATKATMDIIGVAALGREFHALHNDDDEFVKNFEMVLEPSLEGSIYFVTQLVGPPSFWSMVMWKTHKEATELGLTLRRLTTELVQQKVAVMKSGEGEHLDILADLIRSNNFSEKDLVDQTLTFLGAGHETTSSAFTWLTYLLAVHKDWQTKLRREIATSLARRIKPRTGDDFTAALESMPILHGVCEETLRLYPTVPSTIREAVRDTTLAGEHMPKGTIIIISPYATNRNPEFWADADRFLPGRWIGDDGRLNKNGGVDSNYANLTFLHGPRSCIGQNFAKQELMCLVAAFTASFEWDLADPKKKVVFGGSITLKPTDGVHLSLRAVGEA